MITTVAKIKVKEGELENFKQLAKELVEKSRLEEGNISYNLLQSAEDPNSLVYIECWKDMDAVASHRESVHYKTIGPKTGALTVDKDVMLYKDF